MDVGRRVDKVIICWEGLVREPVFWKLRPIILWGDPVSSLESVIVTTTRMRQ